LRAASAAPRNEALVFVHGYNVAFEDAARRTAQLVHDLGYQGVPAFYSWPSVGKTWPYTWDEDSVGWTVPHLKEFLERLIRDGKLKVVHLIAHSMGNRCLAEALLRLEGSTLGGQPFDQCVLAAPDIDADRFRNDIAPGLVGRVQRLTLYASSRDRALWWSKLAHRYPLAGDAGLGIVVVDGMESVDASRLKTDYFGHSYYGDSKPVIADLEQIVDYHLPAAKRRGMRPKPIGATRLYWEFNP
jgi:esterase/lipase superfamily enzyme